MRERRYEIGQRSKGRSCSFWGKRALAGLSDWERDLGFGEDLTWNFSFGVEF